MGKKEKQKAAITSSNDMKNAEVICKIILCIGLVAWFSPIEAASPTPTSFGFRIEADPHYTPTPTPTPIVPQLTIDSFTDMVGSVGSIFTLSGVSDPFAEITLWIAPDEVGTTTTADENGMWRYILTAPLTQGKKILYITARNESGGQVQKDEEFTVRPVSMPAVAVVFTLFLLGVGIVMTHRTRKNENIKPQQKNKKIK